MPWSSLSTLLVLTGLLSGCSTSPSPANLADAPTFERGFQIFPSPRTFDPPGTIFRVDSAGIRRPVVDLSGLLTITPQAEAIPSIAVRGRFSSGAFFAWLGDRQRSIEAERADSALVVVAGAKRERAYEVELRKLLDSAATIIDWGRSGRLYLITETIAADSVHILLSSEANLGVRDSLQLDSVKTRGVRVGWSPQRATEIALRFATPHRIFYKVEQLARGEALEPGGFRRVIRLPVEAVVWVE